MAGSQPESRESRGGTMQGMNEMEDEKRRCEKVLADEK